jgi:hypothetical protein
MHQIGELIADQTGPRPSVVNHKFAVFATGASVQAGEPTVDHTLPLDGGGSGWGWCRQRRDQIEIKSEGGRKRRREIGEAYKGLRQTLRWENIRVSVASSDPIR